MVAKLGFYWTVRRFTCLLWLLAAHKWISYITWWTATYRIVVYDSTACSNTTGPRAWVCTMLVHACQGLQAVWAYNTFRSTYRWSTSVTRKTRTSCKTLRRHKTATVWTTRWWVTWICRHRRFYCKHNRI